MSKFFCFDSYRKFVGQIEVSKNGELVIRNFLSVLEDNICFKLHGWMRRLEESYDELLPKGYMGMGVVITPSPPPLGGGGGD